MQFLTNTDEIDIDVHDMVMDIDDIMHRKITDKTGITVSHHDITSFVVGIIHDNNERQNRIRRVHEELRNDMKEFDRIYNDKVSRGKVIKDLNGIKNKIKFYVFDYVIIGD